MKQPKRLRVAYLSGPVDARVVYEAWKSNQDLAYFGTSYLRQYYEVCAGLDAVGYVITTHRGEKYRVQCGQFTIENRPFPEGLGGVLYHIGMVLWLFFRLPRLCMFRPNLLIVTALQNHWFVLLPVFWFGTRVVAALHCVFWPKFGPQKWYRPILDGINRRIFWGRVTGVIAASKDIAYQLRSLSPIPAQIFLPTYSPAQFQEIRVPERTRPFRIFFAGRMEKNKGVYDLLDIARKLEDEAAGEFWLDLCGEGSELERLRARDLPGNFKLHGFCSQPEMTSMLSQSHLVVVPTRTTFEEGYNMVCAEAILAGRPVVTSAVCPALDSIREAAIEVEPDDVNGYYEAILLLHSDAELYRQKCEACLPLQAKFYDPNNSWVAHLKIALDGSGFNNAK